MSAINTPNAIIHQDTKLKVLRQLELKTASFLLLEHDIVWVRYKNIRDEFGIDQARTHTEAISEINGGQPVHILIDFRGLDIAFSNEARQYFAKDEYHSAFRLSQALLLSSLAQLLVGNFYLKFNRPTCPARLFADPEVAVQWIRSQK